MDSMKVELRVGQFVVEGGDCNWNRGLRWGSLSQMILNILFRCTSIWVHGIHIHIHESMLNTCR